MEPYYSTTKSPGRPALRRTDLVDYFLRGCKPCEDFKVGVEWEKIGVDSETGRAIPYDGPRGVAAIFESLTSRFQWAPVRENGHVIALRKNDTSITLEPGGQIELSGWKAATLDENASELLNHLKEIKTVSDPIGVAWLGLGAQPFSTTAEIPWVPKKRYEIMREALKNRGSLTHAMMKETASVQISVDYSSESDAAEKLRLGMALSPFLTALFGNSPITDGQPNGFRSRRAHIWAHTAPERTGVLDKALSGQFRFEDYVEYALDVPLLFIVRDGRWLETQVSFRSFLENGIAGHRATLEDWELHISTIFTEARFKTYVEIRSVDCQKTRMGLAVAALIKGLFYDAAARGAALALVENLDGSAVRRLTDEAAREGLRAKFENATMLEPAWKLFEAAKMGLERLASKPLALKNESLYLRPLEEMLKEGKNPADRLLDAIAACGSRGDNVRCVIRNASIAD